MDSWRGGREAVENWLDGWETGACDFAVDRVVMATSVAGAGARDGWEVECGSWRDWSMNIEEGFLNKVLKSSTGSRETATWKIMQIPTQRRARLTVDRSFLSKAGLFLNCLPSYSNKDINNTCRMENLTTWDLFRQIVSWLAPFTLSVDDATKTGRSPEAA